MGAEYVPCPVVPGGKVFNTYKDDDICNSYSNVTGVVQLACSSAEEEETAAASLPPNGDELAFCLIYFTWGGFAILNVFWYLHKAADPAPESISKTSTKGYKNDMFGTFLFVFYILMSLSFQVMFCFVIVDYYAGGLYFIGYMNMRKFLIGTFHTSTAWYIFTRAKSDTLRNYYRIRCSFEESQFVHLWKKDDQVIELADDGRVTRTLQYVQRLLENIAGPYGYHYTAPVLFSSEGVRYFDFQCSRYTYDPKNKNFSPHQLSIPTTYTGILNYATKKQNTGLDSVEAEVSFQLAGPNFIYVTIPNIMLAFAHEFSQYFYIYQFSIMWVWYYWSYWNMATVVLVVIVLSGTVKILIKRSSEFKIKSMAEQIDKVVVLRDGKWITADSVYLVRGDIIEVQDETRVPADCILVSGTCILDESMLTGEAMPVQKFCSTSSDNEYEKMKSGKKNSLFAGTVVKQVQPDKIAGQSRVCALVVDTGALTEKGKLVSGILYSAKVNFIFDEHLKVVFMILFLWSMIALAIVSTFLQAEGEGRHSTAWLYGIFVISQVMSPLLPAVFVIGQSMSAGRLATQDIFCVDLSRITVAGKVRVFCFDKTGTLTKSGLNFENVLPVGQSGEEEKTDEKTASHFLELQNTNLHSLWDQAMGCAHTISKLGDNYVGNPVDQEMFKSSGWEMTSDGLTLTKGGETINVIKQYEFDHARMSMAVAVEIKGETHIFVKGSFEKIEELCAGVPANYLQRAQSLASEGNYTLGVGHRNLGSVDAETVRAMSRDEMEQGNECLGLMMFKNNLKDDTAQYIKELKEGKVRPVMITGDTVMTGIHIAKACGMTLENSTVILGDTTNEGQVSWTDISTGDAMNSDMSWLKGDNIELAMTGKAFNALRGSGDIRNLLPQSRIFARMTPTDKVDCVQLHMEKEITAMCGDGGNDCGALRAAHVGVAMSEAEASIVSPFSTKSKSLAAPVQVLKEGRAALATSFSSYSFLIMYGETIVFSKFFYIYFSVQLAEWVWIIIDSFFVVCLSFALTQSKAADKLAPRRPTARLLGPQTVISITSIVLINFLFQMGAVVMLFSEEWFPCKEFDKGAVDASKWWLLADNFEGETIGLLAMFQVANAAFVGNFGSDYRAMFIKNWIFVVAYIIVFIIVSCVVLLDPNELGCKFRFNCGNYDYLVENGFFDRYEDIGWSMEGQNNPYGNNVLPMDFRWKLWALCVGNLVTVVAWYYVVILGPIRSACRSRRKDRPIKI